MLNRYLARFVCAACTVVVLSSCGDKPAGTGEFATVVATANPPSSTFESDVATWVDATTGAAVPVSCGASVATTVSDSVDFTVTSTAYATPNTGSTSTITPSRLRIARITVTLTPANSSTPALPAQFQTSYSSAGQIVAPNTAQSVPVTLATKDLKRFFRNTSALGAQAISCTSNPIYTYWADVSFEALEETTNRGATISPPTRTFKVEFTDLIDK